MSDRRLRDALDELKSAQAVVLEMDKKGTWTGANLANVSNFELAQAHRRVHNAYDVLDRLANDQAGIIKIKVTYNTGALVMELEINPETQYGEVVAALKCSKIIMDSGAFTQVNIAIGMLAVRTVQDRQVRVGFDDSCEKDLHTFVIERL